MREWIAALALVVLIATGVGASLHYLKVQDRWETEAEQALAHADSAHRIAAAWAAEAERLEQEKDSLVAALKEQGRRTRERVVTARAVEEPPDTCAPFIAWRDRVIDSLIAEANGWQVALERQEEATVVLHAARNVTLASNTRLREVLESRPGRRSRWLPELGAGLFAGVDFDDGRPTFGFGVTLSWGI